MTQRRAFVLHSGGLDSTVCLALAVDRYGIEETVSVGVDYGQRHIRELQQAREIAAWYGCQRLELKLGEQPTSMLTSEASKVPDISYAEIKGVSPTYVHFRNGQLLSAIAAQASAWATDVAGYNQNADGGGPLSREATIYFGAHADDAAGDAYPDCTLEFVGAMASAIYVGTYRLVRLYAPLLALFKPDIVRLGSTLHAPLHLSWSCYKGEEIQCGTCPTCRQRREGFEKAGIADLTNYASYGT